MDEIYIFMIYNIPWRVKYECLWKLEYGEIFGWYLWRFGECYTQIKVEKASKEIVNIVSKVIVSSYAFLLC